MRITSQYLLNNFKQDQQKVNQELKRVTEQISSGKKIQNNYDDPSIFNDTLRLDTHINDLKAVQERTQKAQNFTTATDDALQEFTNSLRTFKSQLIAAANAPLNQENSDAIVASLEREKAYMMTLANTQVGGQFVFAGSATSTRPIDENGNYMGNSESISTVLGEGVTLAYNVDGASLFLGSDEKVHKTLSTNVVLKKADDGAIIRPEDKISDLTGDDANPLILKISGTTHDGKTVKSEVTLQPEDTMQTLIEKISDAYGNTPDNRKVDVTLDEDGHITITDLRHGHSQLELKLSGEQNDNSVKFNDNGYTLADPANPDSAYFAEKGGNLTGNVTLIADGKLADRTTRLSAIANGSLDGKQFEMKVTDINGNDHTIQLQLDGTASSFRVDNGTTKHIYNAENDSSGTPVPTKADEMTLGQLNDIIAMAVSGQYPSTDTKAAFDQAVQDARKSAAVSIDQSGRLQIENSANDNPVKFAFYDTNGSDYGDTSATFALNADNAVTTQKAEMDFFSQIDEIIDAVRNGTNAIDAANDNPRNIGIENAIAQIDQFDAHFNKNLAKTGVMEKSLVDAQDRAQSMELSIKELKSQLTDVDIAEAYMNLNQLSLSYQAILSSVTKVNNLTLLNYMK